MAKSPREPKPRQKSLDLFRPASTTPRATASASTSSSKHSPRPASNSTNNRQPSTSASTKPSSSKKRKASEPIVLLLSDDDSDLEILELPPAPKTPRLARAMQRDPSTSRAGLDKGKGKAKETEELDMTGVEPDDMAVVEGESAGGSGEDANGSHHVDPSQKIGKEGGRMEEDEEPPMQDDWGEWEDDEHDAASNDDDAGWGEEPKDAIVDDEDEEDEMREEDWESQLQGVVQGSSKDLESITIDDDDDEDEAPVCPICKIVLSSLPESKRQSHVNLCIDGPSESKTAGGFFAPLSVLFRPRGTESISSKPTSTKVTSSTAKTKAPVDKKPSVAPVKVEKPVVPAAKKESKPGSLLSAIMPNAFTALMSGHTETKQWKAAQEADQRRGRVPKGEIRSVPFYKWIDGMEITVDAFKYGKIAGCKGYFLSHAHSDHYQNLSSSWSHGPIYCSKTTANLIKLKLGVKDEYLKILPMNETVDVLGIKVTLLDANHCPGSVLFLFEGPHTDSKSPYSKTPTRIFRHLHCGDFRASPAHVLHPALKDKKLDIIYLDTTYLDVKYCFPAQELVITACAQLVRERVLEGDEGALRSVEGERHASEVKSMKGWLKDGVKKEESVEETTPGVDGDEPGSEDLKPEVKKKEKLLVMVGTYSIGKERIVKAIAQALETKIYVDDKKRKIFEAQDDPELHSLMSSDPLEACVHVCWLNAISREAMTDYYTPLSHKRVANGFTSVIGLRPTGWTYRADPAAKGSAPPSIAKVVDRERLRKFSAAGMYPQRDSVPSVLAYGVPYSEHSSFYELTCFALSLDYVKITPTVNVATEQSRKKMKEWMDKWLQEKKRRADARIPRLVPPRADNYW